MINILKTDQNIMTLSIDDRDNETNHLNERFITHFETLVEEITRDKSIKGIVLTSSKKDFLLEHDLTALSQMESVSSIYEYIMRLQRSLEMLENWGKPIVAAISGSAVGAGLEVALACHYRVAINHHTINLKFSSPSSGLIPSLGTIQRLTRTLGIEQAASLLLNSQSYNPSQAWEHGLIEALADTNSLMLEMAYAWIEQNPNPVQLWQSKLKQDPMYPKYHSGKIYFQKQSVQLSQKNCPASHQILERIYDGLFIPFHQACKADAESFANLFSNVESKNIIQVLHFGVEDCRNWASYKTRDILAHSKVALLYPSKNSVKLTLAIIEVGIEVVITFQDITTGEAFKNTIALSLQESVVTGTITKESKEFQLTLIEVSDHIESIKACSLIINCQEIKEEDRSKVKLIDEAKKQDSPVMTVLHQSAVEETCCSSQVPQDWLGIDYSSLELGSQVIEIKRSAKSSGMTIKKCLKLIFDIQKIPIVTNDQPCSLSYSLKMAYVTEALIALVEGIDPFFIERSPLETGMTIPPFQLIDQLGFEKVFLHLKSLYKKESLIQNETPWKVTLSKVLKLIEELKPPLSSPEGALFYKLNDNSKMELTPPKLESSVESAVDQLTYKELLADKLVFIQLTKALERVEQKVIQSPVEADVASILASYFPPYTGGILSFIQFLGTQQIMEKYVLLHSHFGDRFKVPKVIKQLISKSMDTPYELDQYFYSNRLEQEE